MSLTELDFEVIINQGLSEADKFSFYFLNKLTLVKECVVFFLLQSETPNCLKQEEI